LKERLRSLETELAQMSANQQAATDSLEQMAKSADVCDRLVIINNKQELIIEMRNPNVT